MKGCRLACALLVAALSSATAAAEVVDCAALSATQRRQAETIGACGAAPKSLCLPATDEGLAALVDLLAAEANYQAEVPCAGEGAVDGFGILVAAGPGDGACTVELAGSLIANPQPRRQVAMRWWRAQINGRITAREAEAAAAAERERVQAATATALPAEDP